MTEKTPVGDDVEHALKVMQSPVQGMEDVVDLTDGFDMAVGTIRIAGVGQRVAVWNGPGAEVRQMSPQEARRFARELKEETGGALQPVVDALFSRADIVQGLV